MASSVRDVADADFQQEVLQAAEPVLVDFGASWCVPCRALEPVLEDLASRYEGRVKVARINVDTSHGVAQLYGVRSLPTLLMFKGGRVVEQIGGAVPRARLEESFSKVL